MAKKKNEIVIPYKPFDKQLQFHNSKAKFRAIITGVGGGKTCAGANELLKMALQHPKSLHLILAPTGKIMQHATLPEFEKYAKPFITSWRRSENTIFIGETKIVYLTADNIRHVERLRGLTIGSYWMDECAMFMALIFEILRGRMRSKYGPLRGIGTTTPRGYNWVHSFFVKKKHPIFKKMLADPENYEWFNWTSFDNPHLPEEFITDLKNIPDSPYKDQEVLGKFTSFEGQVYKMFDPAVNIISKKDLPIMKEYIYCCDWGYTHPLVGIIIGFDSDGRAYVVEEYYERGSRVPILIDWMLERKEKYKLNEGYGDPSEPQFIMEFDEKGLNMYPADNSVAPGIRTVSEMLVPAGDGKPRLFVVEDCENTLEEFTNYKYKDNSADVAGKDEPVKLNDDAMDALRYGLHTHLGMRDKVSTMDAKDIKDASFF